MTAPTTAPRWSDIRTLGPALLIAFGLVLAFTPMASIGASGSVGNAGVQFPKCPTGGGQVPTDLTTPATPGDECPPVTVPCPGGNVGSAAFVVPDDCPEPETPCPTGSNAGNAGIVAPDDCPEPEVPVTETVDPVTEAVDPVTEPEDIAGAGAENVPAPPAPPIERAELPRTGLDRNQLLSTLVGLALVGIGSTLLLASRRRTA